MKSKKILSLLLAIALVFGLLPASFAATGDVRRDGEITEFAVWSLDGAKLNDVTFSPEKYQIEQDGKFFRLEEVYQKISSGAAADLASATALLQPVQGEYKLVLKAEDVEALTKLSDDKALRLDGSTVYTVRAQILNAAGELDVDYKGQVEFVSKRGMKAQHMITALDDGVAIFNITLPSKDEKMVDEIFVRLAETEVVADKGMESAPLELTYYPYDPEAIAAKVAYTVNEVRSLDLGDRVAVYVSNVAVGQEKLVGQAILDQVRIYNNKDLNAPNFAADPKIRLTRIEDIKLANPDDPDSRTFVYTALVHLKDFNPAGYAGEPEDQVDGAALVDNQYNYYIVERVAAAANGVYLEEQRTARKFMVRDKVLPRVEDVKAPLVVDGTIDETVQPAKTLIVDFSEAVSRYTAERPENWVINGHKLEPEDVLFIRVIDEKDPQISVAFGDLLQYKRIAERQLEGKARKSVLIAFSDRAERLYLKGEENVSVENLLQVRSVSDIAGLTDLSDNNKIITQNFLFPYTRPEFKEGLSIKLESPEQYVLTLYDELYVENPRDVVAPAEPKKLDLTDKSILKVELVGQRVLDDDEYRIVPLPRKGEFILELTKDWTEILEIDPGEWVAYHNRPFRVTVEVEKLYDYYGQVRYNEDAQELEKQHLSATWENIDEDVKSPTVTKVDFVRAEEDNYTHKGRTHAPAWVTYSEPIQIQSENGVHERISRMLPAITPSLEQYEDEVPMPTFEYVKVKADSENDYSAGFRVAGVMSDAQPHATEHDWDIDVEAVDLLDAGLWKLVVREASDDVGNTMSTQVFPFKIDDGTPISEDCETYVQPYVIWAYADDDKLEADGTFSDYVYILYSRQMELEAIRAETYDINGKQLGQDADITRTPITLYRECWKPGEEGYDKLYDSYYKPWYQADLVKIKLPADYIVGGDDIDGDRNGLTRKNVLTLPTNLQATDSHDGMIRDLQFDNNGGDNKFELTFYNPDVWNYLFNPGDLIGGFGSHVGAADSLAVKRLGDLATLPAATLNHLYSPEMAEYFNPFDHFEFIHSVGENAVKAALVNAKNETIPAIQQGTFSGKVKIADVANTTGYKIKINGDNPAEGALDASGNFSVDYTMSMAEALSGKVLEFVVVDPEGNEVLSGEVKDKAESSNENPGEEPDVNETVAVADKNADTTTAVLGSCTFAGKLTGAADPTIYSVVVVNGSGEERGKATPAADGTFTVDFNVVGMAEQFTVDTAFQFKVMKGAEEVLPAAPIK